MGRSRSSKANVTEKKAEKYLLKANGRGWNLDGGGGLQKKARGRGGGKMSKIKREVGLVHKGKTDGRTNVLSSRGPNKKRRRKPKLKKDSSTESMMLKNQGGGVGYPPEKVSRAVRWAKKQGGGATLIPRLVGRRNRRWGEKKG